MIAVVQRVSEARVTVEGELVGAVGRGLLVLLAVEKGDSEATSSTLANKIANLRVFPDETGKMDKSVLDIEGELLVVSQFTLAADTSKGRRPSFDRAAPPAEARVLYEHFVSVSRSLGLVVATGRFQADMDVTLTNKGPVTLIFG
jgi:D-aminoacyl-tRNA deacylase